MTKFYITTPIYYVNDKPHIGHAYTTVAADVLARWHKIAGEGVFFLTGTDEHGAKIAESAHASGQKPQVFCDQITDHFQKAWQNLGIDYSYFIRTTDPAHAKGVISFLEGLKQKGFLYQKDYKGLYCVGCEKFLTPKDLEDEKCPDHKRVPQKVTEENWFFKLEKFLKPIRKEIESKELMIQPPQAREEVLGLFRQGLEDFSISRQQVSWGIKLSWDREQTVYVWVDALLNYWTALKMAHKEKFWSPDLQLIGKDILKFHAVYWPAMLLAAGERLPEVLFVHGYFTIDGQKMSKTLGNVIDPNNLVKRFGQEATRFLLLSQFPFGNDGDISLAKLEKTYHADLAHGLGNLVSRVARFPKPRKKDIADQPYDLSLYNQLMQDVQLYDVVKLIREKIKECDTLLEQEKPWEMKDKAKKEAFLMKIRAKVLELAEMIRPFMPKTYEKIQHIFQTGKREILFPKLD